MISLDLILSTQPMEKMIVVALKEKYEAIFWPTNFLLPHDINITKTPAGKSNFFPFNKGETIQESRRSK
jgi:hypothetical protein